MNPIPLLFCAFVALVTHLMGGNWMVGLTITLGICIFVTITEN